MKSRFVNDGESRLRSSAEFQERLRELKESIRAVMRQNSKRPGSSGGGCCDGESPENIGGARRNCPVALLALQPMRPNDQPEITARA